MDKHVNPLTLPTDREIIRQIEDKKRYTPKLVGLLLEKDPSYIASQLRKLESREYVNDPISEYQLSNDRSGMYTLSNLGVVVTFHLDRYVRGHHRVFDPQSRIVLENQPENMFCPDLIVLDEPELIALQKLTEVDGVTIPSELHIEISHDANYSPSTAAQALYTLYYHGLAERVDGMDVYRITDRGETADDLILDGVSDPVELTEHLRETYSSEEWKRLSMFTN